MSARIDRVVTSGIFSLDGQDIEVDNNVWIVGDDTECVLIDAAHDADALLAAGVSASVVGKILRENVMRVLGTANAR